MKSRSAAALWTRTAELVPAFNKSSENLNFSSFARRKFRFLQQKCCCGTKSCRGTIGSKKQKLSGLLMKKKLPVEPINGIMNPVIETVEHAKAATDPVKVISAVPPLARTIADVSPHIVTDSMDKVPRPSASGVHCRNTEKRLVLDQRIYLPRNIRRIDERGLNPEFKRAVSQPCRTVLRSISSFVTVHDRGCKEP